MTDERIELAPWIVEMAQRVVDNNSGEWLTPTWIVAQEALGSVDGWPNDGHSEFVGLLIDEIASLTARLRLKGDQLDAANARVTELTKQLALRCCAENCDKEELLQSDREQREQLTTMRDLLRECDAFFNGKLLFSPCDWDDFKQRLAQAALEGKP